ncbi:MAG: tetratricopeptide repeat protein, partial [Thermodesulfobacteriota bacterium]
IWYMASGILAVILAMKTKEISFTLPFIIVLYEFTFLTTDNQQPVKCIKKRLPYIFPFLLTLPIIPLSRIDAGVGWTEVTKETVSRSEYLFTQFRIIVTYLRLLFLPINQNLDYDYPIYHSFFDPQVYLSFFFLLSIFVFALYIFLRSRITNNGHGILIAFGLFWFFITLSIESSIIPLKNVIFEHRLYLPSVGFIIAFISALYYGFEWIGRRWQVIGNGGEGLEERKRYSFILIPCLFFLTSVFTVSLSFTAYQRNLVWRDEYTLWKDTVDKSPNKARPRSDLGLAYAERGQWDQAIVEYKETLHIDPYYIEAHNNLGNALAEQGKLDEAILHYTEALRINPSFAKAHNNLGLALAEQGKLDEAILHYAEALRINPYFVKAHNNLGVALAEQGKLDEAILH